MHVFAVLDMPPTSTKEVMFRPRLTGLSLSGITKKLWGEFPEILDKEMALKQETSDQILGNAYLDQWDFFHSVYAVDVFAMRDLAYITEHALQRGKSQSEIP